MANRQRGDVDVEVDGKVYTLQLGVNAMAWVESKFGPHDSDLSFQDIFKRIESRKRITDIRAVFCAAMQEHHPGTTEQEAGKIMQAIGLVPLSDVLRKVVRAAMPDQRDVDELDPNPPQAQAEPNRGHGDRSTSMHAKSA